MDEVERVRQLARAVTGRVPVDAAALLQGEPLERIGQVLQRLPKRLVRDILEHLPPESRPMDPMSITSEMMVPGTVADLMEPLHGKLPETATVQQAIDFLRSADNARQITYLYTVDGANRLTGLVVIRDLLLTDPQQPLTSVMLPAPFSLPLSMTANDAVHAAVHRHYPVYPVVDGQGHPIGVVRGWRLFEHQAIEITAQSGKMVGVGTEERVYTGLFRAFKMRHPWLQINLLTAFLAGFVVSLFEGTISQIVVLAAFLPILAGQCGNTGCQALAITLRGLTLGDMQDYPVRKLLLKELALGALNGLFTGLIAGAAMWWSAWHAHNAQAPLLAFVIVAAMVSACMLSGLFGVMVPLVLRRVGADPATASSIFLTTGTDIASMGLMLALATALVL